MSAGADVGMVMSASVRRHFCELVSRRLVDFQMSFLGEDNWIQEYGADDDSLMDVFVPSTDQRLALLERGHQTVLAAIAELKKVMQQYTLQSGVAPGVHSDTPSPSSPYMCPFCLCRQKSPKSHAEHLANMLKGVSGCRIDISYPRHGNILHLFHNDLGQFVNWWLGHLRCSKDASQVSQADRDDFARLQVKLEEAIERGELQL